MMVDINKIDYCIEPELPRKMDYKIGIIGAGFIVQDCHLKAYSDIGFNPYAIASLTWEKCKKVADRYQIPNAYKTWKELVDDENVEILDIAIPPDKQLEIVRYAVTKSYIKGILCQKPLAMNLEEAKEIVKLCKKAGIKLGVNSNMRYDQSIRALKTILEKGYLGKPILATIDMRAIPHWQTFLQKYERVEILNMGIHHIDTFRYLFGDPEIEKMFYVLDDKIKIAHAKDCKRAADTGEKFGGGSAEHNSFRGAGAVELPAAGLRVLNYELYLERLKINHPNIPIIIEHLDESDIPRAKRFVDRTLKHVGA